MASTLTANQPVDNNAGKGAANQEQANTPSRNEINFDFCKNQEVFKITMNALHDKRLTDDLMYQKMLARLQAFYVMAERYRRFGPTPKQAQVMNDTGYPFRYHVELHRCLKNLLLNITKQKNPKVLRLHLKEVYRWMINKLFQMGVLSKEQMMKEADVLNPLAQTMGARLREAVEDKIKSNLVDETELRKQQMAMFEEPDHGLNGAERTAHKQIAPASIRIQSVKTRSLKGLQGSVD